MKTRKEGKPFTFPYSFILVISHTGLWFQLSYRQTEGMIKDIVGKTLPSHPS